MYVITGATGNTGKEIAEALLKAGKPVTVIGRSAERLADFVAQGAKIAVGNLEDSAFLAKTFAGATAVYAMIPPKWDLTTDWRTYQREVGKSMADAIHTAGVQKVVVLSSNGAHLPEGAGPVTGLHEFEQMLKAIPHLDILSLRAGYFMQNLFALTGMIKHMGIFGYSLRHDVKTPLVHTRDIAEVAIKHLLSLDFKGFQHVFVAGAADLTMDEVAEIIGKGIGKNDLKYVTFNYEAARAGMIQNGLPATIADGYNELFKSLNDGLYLNDYQRDAQSTTPTSLEWFVANEFVYAYQNA
jgi:uncharacterized protein YbjT (DUF2867 family)